MFIDSGDIKFGTFEFFFHNIITIQNIFNKIADTYFGTKGVINCAMYIDIHSSNMAETRGTYKRQLRGIHKF